MTPTDQTISVAPAIDAADTSALHRELRFERLRRTVYESVARHELLSHTLACLTRMIEQETPRLTACIVYRRSGEADRVQTIEAIAGRGGESMSADCVASASLRQEAWPAAIELWEPLAILPPWGARDTCGENDAVDAATLWTLPLPSGEANDPVAGSLVMCISGSSAPTEAERAVAALAAELAGFAVGSARLADRAIRQLMQDDLTGLPNATLLKDRLAQAAEQARRQKMITLLMLVDLIGLGAVNESLGHGAGDDVICKVADRLRTGLRRSDTIARIGGDKFAVVVNMRDAESDVAAVANKVISLIGSPIKVCGREVSVGANIGLSVFPNDSDDPAELMGQAELALRRSKACGRNAIQFFTTRDESGGLATMEMETRFRRCVEFALMSQALGGQTVDDPSGGKLELHYQPQVDHAGRIVGVEALARWTDPTLGRVPPDRFIAAAERNGMIITFGRWALNQAAAQARRWADRFGSRAPRVAVNVSAMQFASDRFVEEVATVLNTYHLTPRLLELELTETVLMHDADEAAHRIGQLRAMGVSVAIDDFGTGYSSLAYLHRLTIDTLKVDRSFVAGIAGERRGPNGIATGPLQGSGAAVTRAIISMGRSLGMNVLAEGVEDDTQRHLLIRMGCDQMQGYLFSPPVPATQLEALLTHTLPLAAPAAQPA